MDLDEDELKATRKLHGLDDEIVLDFQKIAKIQHLYIEIFYEEDSDYPDYRVIRPKERIIDKLLNSLTDDKEKQKEIYDTIIHYTWDNSDMTYRPICNALREKGYKIINNEERK